MVEKSLTGEKFNQNKNVTPDRKVDFAKRSLRRPFLATILFPKLSVFSQTLMRCCMCSIPKFSVSNLSERQAAAEKQ